MLVPALAVREWQVGQRRRYPEWWVGVLVAAAWLVVLIDHRGGVLPRIPFMDSSSGVAQHHRTGGTASVESDLGSDLWYWTVMSIAMMAPVTFPALRYVVLNSFAHRRTRAQAVFLLAFGAIWVGIGLVLLISIRTIRADLDVSGRVLLVVGLGWAAFWQLTPVKRRALIACGRAVPLRPAGIRADVSCARYGAQQGWRCVRSCGPLMALMVLAGHAALLWMLMLTAYVIVEERSEYGLKLLPPSATVLAMLLVGFVFG